MTDLGVDDANGIEFQARSLGFDLESLAHGLLVTPDEALAGFSNPAVVTVWAMFILSAALTQAGVADVIGVQVLKLAGKGEFRAVLVIMLLSSCTSGDQQAAVATSENTKKQGQAYVQDDDSAKNILQVALSSPDHTTLVAGVQAAELENVLVNAGPLTVFAPTNAAFDKLPAGTLETLLKPENKDQLARIITSHAAPGTYKGALLKDGARIYQATGHYVYITEVDGVKYVNGIEILATVDASNGVVHVIDEVLLLD